MADGQRKRSRESTQQRGNPRACGRGRTLEKTPVISWTLRPLSLWARQVRANTYGAAYGPPARARFGGSACPHLNTEPAPRTWAPPTAYGHRRLNGVVERHQRGTRRQELATSRRRGTSRAQRSDLRPGSLGHGRDYLSGNYKSVANKERVISPRRGWNLRLLFGLAVRPR